MVQTDLSDWAREKVERRSESELPELPELHTGKAFAQLAMPPAQKPAGAEGAERALPREQPTTADADVPTPVNNESAGAEGAEFIAQDLSQDPPGNDDLLQHS